MKKKIVVVTLGIALFILSAGTASVSAASLRFDPTSVSSQVDGTFGVDVIVDSGADEILGVDVLIRYDSDLLEVVSISDGTHMTIGKKDLTTPHKIYFAPVVDDPASAVSGVGTVATINFKSKVESTSELNFECELGETNESNILKNDLDATDIITCSDNGKSTIVIGAGGSTIDSGTTKSPSTLPRSGAFENLALFGVIGGILLLVGGSLRFMR